MTDAVHVMRRRVRLVGGIVLAGTVAALATGLVAPAALAAVPEPGADQAVVQLYVGDYRTGPTQIGPVVAGGVVFGLFADNPSAAIHENDGFVDASFPPLFTCTSQADGDCVFTVPIRDGAPSSTGVAEGTRLWAAPISSPASIAVGYYANPFWQTAPLSNTSQTSLRHTFQTPELVGGQQYLAGADWITDPGQQTVPANATSEFTRRVASGGVWPLSRYDPALPAGCGLNVAIVVDLSSSVAQANAIGPLKSAIDAFVDALHGTPSQAALFTFGTDSPAAGYGPNTGLMPVATTADANAFKALYAGWTNPPTNYTNWDRGFAAAAAVNDPDPASPDHFDLAVFITDGNPTVYGPAPLSANGQLKDRNSGYTRFRELGNGLASANLLKSQGTRILAVGVGTGVAGTGSEYNLRTISGRDPYDGSNILDADYFQTTDYAAAGAALHDVVLAGCAPSISVIKRIVPPGGTVADAYLPGEQWSFAASSSTAGTTIVPAAGLTDLATGGIAFDLAFDAGVTPTVTVDEDLATAPWNQYTPYVAPGDTAPLVQCVDKSADDATVPVAPTASATGLSFDVTLGQEDAISCVVYNQAPPDVVPASVVVDKRWAVTAGGTTTVYDEGAQPAGLDSALSLTGPANPGLTEQGWGVPRSGYNVGPTRAVPLGASTVSAAEHVAVTGLPGCVVTRVTLEDGTPADSAPGSGTALYSPSGTPPQVPPTDPQSGTLALAAGTNAWTVTNEVTCTSRLTLVKDVAGGGGDAGWWDLEAIAPDGALAGPSGASGTPGATAVEVTPDVAYQLAEAAVGGAPHDVLHYVQEDLRSEPLQYPGSSGSWACDPGPSSGAEGAVVVPLGGSYTCAAVNRTALLTVTKTVQGGTARPTDFVFDADPLPPVVPGGDDHEVVPGAVQTLVPGQHYRLTEASGPEGYELTSLTCRSEGTPLDPADFVLLPGASLQCAATNVAVLPATGSTTWWGWPVAAGLIAVGLALVALARRRPEA